MKKNMGGTDRIIRFVLALGVGALYYFKVIDGALAYVLLAIAAIFLITSFVSVCPLYSLFGMKTCKTAQG
jgi:predicted membrane-bound spermidine synthase